MTLTPWLWLTVPLWPLFSGLLLSRHPRYASIQVVAALPAALLVLWPAEPLVLTGLWPGAQWGFYAPLNQALLGFTALLWAVATLYAASSEADQPRQARFWFFWSTAMTGNFLLLIALDPVSFYVGFTLMSLAAYGLIVHYQGPLPRQAGRLYLQLAVLGEMLLYAAIVMRVHETGGLVQFADWQTAPIQPLTALLFLIGFGLKAGFWPLHIWLPLAHPVAPAAASAVLSGAMLKAGILGIWQFIPADSDVSRQTAEFLFILGLFSAFYAVGAGLLQHKAKTVLAFSSVSQISYLLMIIAMAWRQPDDLSDWGILLAFYAVHHGLAKGALFLGAGLTARYRLSLVQFSVLLLPALALAGLPWTTGALVKTQLKTAVMAVDWTTYLPILTLGSLATGLLVARALWCMWRDQQHKHLPPAPTIPLWCWLFLSFLPVLLPLLWPSLSQHVSETYTVNNLRGLLWPIALAAVITAGMLAKPVNLPRVSPQSGRWLSLRIKFWQDHVPLPPLTWPINQQRWRHVERRLNHLSKVHTVSFSVLLVMLGIVVLALLLH